METTCFRDLDGLDVMRADVLMEDHTSHQIALSHCGGAMGLYSEEAPLDLMVYLLRPHEDTGTWRMVISRSVTAEDEETTIPASQGQEMLDFWDLARRASMAGSLPL